MAIELAPDNHIGELKRLSKSDLQYAAFETLEEFAVSEQTHAYSCDESGYWACISNGVKYYGHIRPGAVSPMTFPQLAHDAAKKVPK